MYYNFDTNLNNWDLQCFLTGVIQNGVKIEDTAGGQMETDL